jgi:hypothetical protein
MKQRGCCPQRIVRRRRLVYQSLKDVEWPLWRCDVAIRSMWRKRNAAIKLYIATRSLELSYRVASLPRELRDIIYDYLLKLDVQFIRSVSTHISDTVRKFDCLQDRSPWSSLYGDYA